MSMFGGLDLGTPDTRNEAILRRELELRRNREPVSGWGKEYPTGADLLLAHGTFRSGRELPEQYHDCLAEAGSCFWGAAECAETHGLRYFEGLASTGGGRFMAHGWCLDADGVVDPTWAYGEIITGDTDIRAVPHDRWSYFGVEIAVELMRKHEDLGFPMLGRDPVELVVRNERQRGLDLQAPERLPLLDVQYDPTRRTFA